MEIEIHREVLIEHIKKIKPDYHITLQKYELHKSRDSIMCYIQECHKKEYVFNPSLLRVMYSDYNLSLRKYKLNNMLNNDI